MHYCGIIMTNEFPTDDVIEKRLAPYKWPEPEGDSDEDLEPEEEEHIKKLPLTWDWWQLGGRYCGKLRLRVDPNNDTYKWNYILDRHKVRTGRLFRSRILEDMHALCDETVFNTSFVHNFEYEEYLYNYFGLHDGYIRVDGCPVKDLLVPRDVTNSWFFIPPTDEVWTRSKDADNYDQLVMDAVEIRNDAYVCVVDLHD